ncbi:MAG: ribosome small subunit-dependent GTPase A [Anaerolineaceae bacterium]|nr:ribosome small subunit-dependent GTPase A [Anaerolineaceae bacterium]
MSKIDTKSHDQGVVFKKNNAYYWVQANGQSIQCTLSNNLRRSLPGSAHTDPLAVGDVVTFIPAGDGTSGQITALLPRRNRLARRSAVAMPGAHAFEQVIAANVDQVVPVFAAAAPPPRWNMLDRYLVSAESLDLPSLVVITKLDLADGSGELTAEVDTYRTAGYPVILSSTVSREGIDEIKHALQGKTSVLVGKSGVGKTSLLNAIQPGLGLRVGEVSSYNGKGRHTTSQAVMYELEFGGTIVDTPGVREFGLWDINEDDLALFFPEMRPYVGRCKFGLDCQHADEPGCALRKAVVAGTISPRRYQSYMRLLQEGYFL